MSVTYTSAEYVKKQQWPVDAGTINRMNEERPPVDFQISSSGSSDTDNFAFDAGDSYNIGEKCPLCLRLKKHFTCNECLLKGDFSHSPSPPHAKGKTSYSELKLKYLLSKQKRSELIEKCEEYTKKKQQIADIVQEIENYAATIKIEKELRETLKQRILIAQGEAESMRKSTTEKEQRWPLYRSRLDNMNQQYRHKIAKLQKFHAHVQGRKGLLKSVSKTGILQLKEYVFPIHEVGKNHADFSLNKDYGLQDKMNNSSGDLWEDEEDDTVSALMAASSYWGRPDDLVSSFGKCYCITGVHGPSLPESGDYSAYNMWSDRNEGITAAQSNTRNPAHCIAGALTYTTLFVNLIAYYLDLRLPHRLSYSEFTNGNLVGGKFNRKVAKLNANVIHLCASQGIAPTFLQPRRTIPNLLLLFDPEMADLGSRGPFEVATQLAKSMEESIEKDLVIYEEDSSESENDWSDSNFPSDWENVQRGTITDEVSAEHMTNHNQSYFLSSSPSQYASDMFTRSRQNSGGGFVSSVASFFKGWGK